MKEILHTKRLLVRELEQTDLEAMRCILQDIRVMYAWEHAFSNEECAAWLGRNQGRYQQDGCGYWAVVELATGDMVGMVGLVMENIEGQRELGVGYLLRHNRWGLGYATEAARACVDAAFAAGAKRVVADIRPENESSLRVARALGMHCTGQFIKHYQGKDMPHDLYVLQQF